MTDISNSEKKINIFGEFRDKNNEKKFREATWSHLTDRTGKTALLAAGFFLIAGVAPFFIANFTDTALKLLVFRTFISLWGVLLFYLSKKIKHNISLLSIIAVFIIIMGLFESIEAVLSYRPDFEYNIPFTLLIILLSYILFPLSIRTVAPASLFSSASYIIALGVLSAARWTDLIQLSIFFMFVNIMGLNIFIQLSKNRRYRYLSYNEINKLYFLLNEEIMKRDEANKKLSVLAETDDLTGIANRRKYFLKLENEYSKSIRYNRPMSVLMLDIDHFKCVNDNYGHDTGDQVIREYVNRCKDKLRQSDIIARIGGEEFSVILPETTEEGAFILAERIRCSIEKDNFCINDISLKITSSCGIASAGNIKYRNSSDLVKAADNALYEAKNSGRNRSCICNKDNANENN